MKNSRPASNVLCQSTHNRSCGSIAEFGPAMFILFVVVFFPLVALVMLGLKYMAGHYLFTELLAEARTGVIITANPGSSTPTATDTSCCDPSIPTSPTSQIIAQWRATGLGRFTSPDGPGGIVVTKPTNVGPPTSTPQVQFVALTMTLKCNPIFGKTSAGGIPGFTNDATFAYSGTTLVENFRNF